MAQLIDTIVNGNLAVTGNIDGNVVNCGGVDGEDGAHAMSMSWDGENIIVGIDGDTVKEISDSTHTHWRLYNSSLDDYISFIKDGDFGYFRANTGDLVCCGSSTRPWYKTYTNRLEVMAAKPVFEYVGSDGGGSTVSYATNMYVGPGGTVSRTTNTSSKTIKHDIKDLQNEDVKAELLYKLPIYQAKYNEDVLGSEDKRYLKDLPMFIIEEMDEIYPVAVDKPSDNVKDWSWNSQYLIPPMLKLIQEQKKEIDELKEKVSILETKIS